MQVKPPPAFPIISFPPSFPLQVKGKSCFWAELKTQQCYHQGKPVKFQAQRAQNCFCSFEWGRERSNAWKMEQGVSIYIHKGKAKEQLLDNGFPATSLGALKGRDKKQGTIWAAQLMQRKKLIWDTLFAKHDLWWLDGDLMSCRSKGLWHLEGEQHPPHQWIFSPTTITASIFPLV